MATAPIVTKQRLRRSVRLLQLASMALIILGGICLLPFIGDFWDLLSLATGLCGVVGLACEWKRLLVIFTLLAWATSIAGVARIVTLAMHPPPNPIPWIIWPCTLAAALPAAILSSTLVRHDPPRSRAPRPPPPPTPHPPHPPSQHLLRAWSSSRGEDHTAPLVDPAAAPAAGALPPAQAGVPAPRPVWPPQNAAEGASQDTGAQQPVNLWPPPSSRA